MKRRTLTVTIHDKVLATVHGYGSRALITSMRGRPPIWSVNERGWVLQPKHARDLAALAEIKGYEVHVIEAGDSR